MRRQFGAMEITRRQACQRIGDLLSRQAQRLSDGSSFDEIGGHAGAGDGCGATVRLECGLFNDVLSDPQPDFDRLPIARVAGGVAVRIRETAQVMRTENMINGGFRI